jgi:hypothetical protein
MAFISRRAVRSAVVALTALAALPLSVGGAAATTLTSKPGVAPSFATPLWNLINANTHRCVDDSAGYGLRANTCNGLNYQQFQMPGFGQTIDTIIKNQQTGYCLDDSLGYGLRAIACNGLDYQQWFYDYDSVTGKYALNNVVTGRWLDDSANYGLRANSSYNGLSYQEFNINPFLL